MDSMSTLFEYFRGATSDTLSREDVDEISSITGMSVKASRKLLRKYRGNKEDALMAWFDKDVDSDALEAASDSENEDDREVDEKVEVSSNWPVFPDAVEWITATSGCTLDLSDVKKPDDPSLIPEKSKPGDIVPADAVLLRVAPGRRPTSSPEDEGKEIFAGLTIGQPIRIRRFQKEMRQSRAGWKDDSEFDQKRLCGRIGTVRAVTRRNLTARVEFNGFGSGWWDIRWLDPLPAPLHVDNPVGCSGFVRVTGEPKQVKLALRCVSQITTCIRLGGLGVFLGPVRKALDQVVPGSKGEIIWRSICSADGEVAGYELCICDPRVVGPVARCLEGELTWNIDRKIAVSEEVVTRVAKLARCKTGCVVVSAPKGEAKMDAGALVVRNPRCWVGGNADGLDGARVAPGVVLGCESGRAQVFWANSKSVSTHRWGFDDTFDLVLMPFFGPIGRLLVVLIGIDRVPGLTWDMLTKVVHEALTMEGSDLVSGVLRNPLFKWNGDAFASKFDTVLLACEVIDAIAQGWARDGVLPPPLVSKETSALLEAFQREQPPVGGHLGIWREAKVTVHQFYCSTPSRREGPICQHPGGAIQTPHWGCCGQTARSSACRQIEKRTSPWHPKHLLVDRTMSIVSWACDKCKSRVEPQQGQRWRCELCDYDLCDPCMLDSTTEAKRQKIVLTESPASFTVLTTILDSETECRLEDGKLLVTPFGCKMRVVKKALFSQGEEGTQPTITFHDDQQPEPKPPKGGVHGFGPGQKVHASKDIYVSVAVAVPQGGHGHVEGPSTSGDPRRVCVKFLGREAKINVMPNELRPLLPAPRKAKVAGKPVAILEEPAAESAALCEIACGSEIHVLADHNDFSYVEYTSHRGYVPNTCLRELNTQATIVMLSSRGLAESMSTLRSIAQRARVQCDIPASFELTVGGKLPAVVVSNLIGDMAALNGVYRRAPAEEDCRVIFRKGMHTLYFRGSWWKLNNNTRHDGWLQSARALVGQWSAANTQDARTDVPYPRIAIGRVKSAAVRPPPGDVPTELLLAAGKVLSRAGGRLLFAGRPVQSVGYRCESVTLVLNKDTLVPVPHASLVKTLERVKAMACLCAVSDRIPTEVDVVEAVEQVVEKSYLQTPERLNELVLAAVKGHGGESVQQLSGRFGWEGRKFKNPLNRLEMAQMARQLHELVGEKLTADISLEVTAPKSTTVAVVGPHPGRQRAKGFLSRLHDLQEVAIRVPSENHAVVERHRSDIQKHAHTHMNIGFGGAIVRLTGTASAIRYTRKAIATLLMKHWREQQRQRREVVLEQVVASAMEVHINVPLSPAMKELLNRKEPALPSMQRRHDEAEGERRHDEQRLVSMTQELSREYERLSNSLRNQLAACGMLRNLCADDFTRGDRVVRGPTWQWGDQDGGTGSTGTVLGGHDEDGWVVVEWDKSGRLARHRTGPLFQDLQHVEPVQLPKMVPEGEADATTVLRARSAAHVSHALDILRQCAICKLSWAEEEHRQKGVVHEARIGVKEMEAAEKFQGWLRDLFGVKERAAQEVAEVKQLIESDKRELAITSKMIAELSLGDEALPPSSGELCICVVTADLLHGAGNTPFDVCSRKSIPRQGRLKLSTQSTVADCYAAIETHLNIAVAQFRLWYFSLQPNGTYRPCSWLRPSDKQLLAACQPPPHIPGEIQVLVETIGNEVSRVNKGVNGSPDIASSVAVKWKVEHADGLPTVPFRTARDSQSTKDIPTGADIEVTGEEGAWVRVLWEGAEGVVRRSNVTQVVASDTTAWSIVFLKWFNPVEGSLQRLGFKVIDLACALVGDLTASVNEHNGAALDMELDVYLEEAPEHLRKIDHDRTTQPLSKLGIRSGSILIFQPIPPNALSRSLRVGDVVVYAGPANRSTILDGAEGKIVGINHAQSQVKVTGKQGETEVFSHVSLALDPKSVGLSYRHGTVPAMFSHLVRRTDLPPPQCRAGHVMHGIDNPRRYLCSSCQAPGVTEMAFWGCRTCDYNLCLLCTIEARLVTKVSPELSPRHQSGAMRFPSVKIEEMLKEHADRVERMLQSLLKHRGLLDSVVSEVLMHVRRLGEQRQHRRMFGWDLLLNLMDTTGCLLELQEENLVVVGRPLSVQKAMSAIKTMQRDWPPSFLPTSARAFIGDDGVHKLFSGAGLVARGLQFECGLQDIELVDDSTIWIAGRRENVVGAADRLDIILNRSGGSRVQLEWADTASPALPAEGPPDCPICLCEIEDEQAADAQVLACSHAMHVECGLRYLDSQRHSKDPVRCPMDNCKYVMRVSEYADLAKGDPTLQ
eukprot:gene15410-23560_t